MYVLIKICLQCLSNITKFAFIPNTNFTSCSHILYLCHQQHSRQQINTGPTIYLLDLLIFYQVLRTILEKMIKLTFQVVKMLIQLIVVTTNYKSYFLEYKIFLWISWVSFSFDSKKDELVNVYINFEPNHWPHLIDLKVK